MRAPIAARPLDIDAWLAGDIDEPLLARWLSRFALFDWTVIPKDVRALVPLDTTRIDTARTAISSTLVLYGLFHPLFDLRPVPDNGRKDGRDLLPPETGARTPAAAHRIAALLRGGNIERAVDVARSRYGMARAQLMHADVPLAVENPERLLAAVFVPVSNFDRAAFVQRWLRPQRREPEVIHA